MPIWIRLWRVIAVAEGVLLPAIVLLALIRGPLHVPGVVVAVVGASHGSVFTAYLVLLPAVARRLRWSRRRLLVAAVASVVPFATWRVERELRRDFAATRFSRTGAGQVLVER